MGTGCFCHLLCFPLIIMQIGHSPQHFLSFCLFKQYFCEPTWQSRPGMRVHCYDETEFIASPSCRPFLPTPLPPAASAEPGAGSGAERGAGEGPSLHQQDRAGRTPVAGIPGDGMASAWWSLSRGHIHPGTVAGRAEAPTGTGSRPALCCAPSTQ